MRRIYSFVIIFFTFQLTTPALATLLNCSLISLTNNHCNLANDLIDINSTITITSVVGRGFETSVERLSTHEFSAAYHEVKFLPRNFADFFPNLEIISIIHAGLSKIQQKDFAHFPNLLEIDLSNNNIRKIERNLFKFNLKLREIRMDENPIIEIHPMAFVGLKNVEKIKMGKVYFDWTTDGALDVTESEKWNFYGIFAIISGFVNVWLLSVVCGVFWRRRESQIRRESEERRKLSENWSNFTGSLGDSEESLENGRNLANKQKKKVKVDKNQQKNSKNHKRSKYEQKRSKTEPIIHHSFENFSQNGSSSFKNDGNSSKNPENHSIDHISTADDDEEHLNFELLDPNLINIDSTEQNLNLNDPNSNLNITSNSTYKNQNLNQKTMLSSNSNPKNSQHSQNSNLKRFSNFFKTFSNPNTLKNSPKTPHQSTSSQTTILLDDFTTSRPKSVENHHHIYSEIEKRNNYENIDDIEIDYSSPADFVDDEVVYAEPDLPIHIYDDVFEGTNEYENIATGERKK